MMKNKKLLAVIFTFLLMVLFSSTVSAAFTFELKGVTTPSALKVGDTFQVKGTLTSNKKMARVVLSIFKDGSQIQRFEANPNAKKYNLAYADHAMLFDKLPAGEYVYRIVAYTAGGMKKAAVNKKFTVKAVSKIKITNPSPAKDFSINQGGVMTVAGKISSRYPIASVTARIVNSNGKVVQSKTVKPKTKTYNMTTKKTLDNAMQFDKLASGSYKFQVKVVDTNGKAALVINRKCTVKAGNTSGGAIGGNGNGQYSDTTNTVNAPAGYKMRTSRPAASNKYYYNANYNIYYKYDSLAPTAKPYYSGHYVVGNCTWYACGRAMEIAARMGGAASVSKVQAIFGGDPVQIFKDNARLGKFKYGSSPKPGSLAVFNYGGNSGDAHIAVVEAVINGVPYVSESGYKVSTVCPAADRSDIVFWYQSIYAWSGGRELLGYIYLC